jgi:hypothetical protein
MAGTIYPTPHTAYALYRDGRRDGDEPRFFPAMLAAIVTDDKGVGHAAVFTKTGELVNAAEHVPLRGFKFYRVMSTHQVAMKFMVDGPFFVPRTNADFHSAVVRVIHEGGQDNG